MRQIARVIAAFVALVSIPGLASAQVGMGNCALFAGSSGATGTLVELYPGTGGTVRTVGTLSRGITALAQNPVTGVVYATTAQVPGGGGFARDLVIVNIANAALTTVGPINLGVGGIADIAFRNDGTLFGWNENTDDLITLNLATGAGTIVGNAGISTRGSGMEFLQDGRLLFAGQNGNGALRTVAPATGLTTVIGTLTGAPFPTQPINAMTVAPDGSVWASNRNISTTAANLIRINPATAVITDVGASLPNMDAVAWICAPAVPTMSDWIMWLTAATLLVVGTWQIRRRRHVMV